MSRTSQQARRLALAGLAATAALGASASAADAANITLTYQCNYPLINEAPLEAQISLPLPETIEVGKPTGDIPVTVKSIASGKTYSGLTLVGAAKLEGTALSTTTIHFADGSTRPVNVPVVVAPFIVPPTESPLILDATGTTPSQTFTVPGPATVSIDGLALSIKATKTDGSAIIFPGSGTDSDGNPDTFDVTCRLDPLTQNTTVATIDITPAPVTTPPSTPASTPVTTPPSTPITTPPTTPKTTPVTTPVTTPKTTPVTTPKTTPVTTPKTTPPTTPKTTPPTSPGVPYAFEANGSATLKTLVKGVLPLHGSIDAELDLGTGGFTADLALDPTQGKLIALGFLPIVAKVEMVSTAPVVGSLKSGVLTANAKVRIKLPSVTVFGLKLGGGSTCQAKKVSNITLKSTQPVFNPIDGGPIAGSFDISDLTGCGFLNGLISPLTAGKGNAIALNLTPTF